MKNILMPKVSFQFPHVHRIDVITFTFSETVKWTQTLPKAQGQTESCARTMKDKKLNKARQSNTSPRDSPGLESNDMFPPSARWTAVEFAKNRFRKSKKLKRRSNKKSPYIKNTSMCHRDRWSAASSTPPRVPWCVLKGPLEKEGSCIHVTN